MLFMVILTTVLSSEYLLNMLLKAHLALFLGAPEDNFNMTATDNLTSQESFMNGTYFYEKSENFEDAPNFTRIRNMRAISLLAKKDFHFFRLGARQK